MSRMANHFGVFFSSMNGALSQVNSNWFTKRDKMTYATRYTVTSTGTNASLRMVADTALALLSLGQAANHKIIV